MSIRSSVSNLHPISSRPFSTSSGVSEVSTTINGNSSDVADDDSSGEYGDGNATPGSQVRALLADVADKNRYIATLERRLLQARRTSQPRTSMGFSPPQKVPGAFSQPDVAMETLLKERDEEIAELRAQLDDKEKMVTALRSAARKRDAAETGGKGTARNSKASIDGVSGVGGVCPGGRGPGVGVRARTSSDSVAPLRTKASMDSVAPLRTRVSMDSVAPLNLKTRGSTDSATSVAESAEEDGTF